MRKYILFLVLLVFCTVSCQSFWLIHNNALLIEAVNKNDHKKPSDKHGLLLGFGKV